MNETWNESNAAAGLNRVDGFDPARFVRKLAEPDGNGQLSEKSYLDVSYRKLWFRLRYPEGAIRLYVKEMTDSYAVVEARVYLDRNDPPDGYVANAIVKRCYSPDDRLGDRYLETAETAAAGRALADAGFGLQFSDAGTDPEAADLRRARTAGPSHGKPARQGSFSYTAGTPVEEIMAAMTIEEAMNAPVDCGTYKGKTLGEVAREVPQSLNWYVSRYRGNNNVLRAAAALLLKEAAEGGTS